MSVQSLDALARANEIRSERARIKRLLRLEPSFVLAYATQPTPATQRWAILELLDAVPRIGRSRTRRLLRRAGVPPLRPVGELTDRQRDALVDALERFLKERV